MTRREPLAFLRRERFAVETERGAESQRKGRSRGVAVSGDFDLVFDTLSDLRTLDAACPASH